jgi:hypothetical protein
MNNYRKYRIIEENGYFYPQEKRWFYWVYLDNMVESITLDKYYKSHSECFSLELAKKVINNRIDYLKRPKDKMIIHEYDE